MIESPHATCPYGSLPDHAYWRRAVAQPAIDEIDPVTASPFRISPTDRIATAGSCFAQNIARYLASSGFNYLVTERPHSMLSSETAAMFGYGVFSARYANIYTARQLKQLLERAYGEFDPVDDRWIRGDGRVIDPFRPFIQPDGFSGNREFDRDRDGHFRAVRNMVESLDYLVFTLGLTETWLDRRDGSCYPVAPGCGAGRHDPNIHEFHNLTVDETVADMRAALTRVFEVNHGAKVILTVSPVPLIATMESQHVMVSTAHSKSVLRVAAGILAAEFPNKIAYFPSYEMITGNFNRGAYFESDLRNAHEDGVRHVMRSFFRWFTTEPDRADDIAVPRSGTIRNSQATLSEAVADVICEEEQLVAGLVDYV
jgi:hypothetical protein